MRTLNTFKFHTRIPARPCPSVAVRVRPHTLHPGELPGAPPGLALSRAGALESAPASSMLLPWWHSTRACLDQSASTPGSTRRDSRNAELRRSAKIQPYFKHCSPHRKNPHPVTIQFLPDTKRCFTQRTVKLKAMNHTPHLCKAC